MFLEEERERELEALYDGEAHTRPGGGGGGEGGGEDGVEAESVQKQTAETLMSGEKIMEALELADEEKKALKAWQEEVDRLGPEKGAMVVKPERPAELKARGDTSGEEHVWKTVRGVQAANMEDALLVLPFRQVVSLLGYIDEWTQKVGLVSFTFDVCIWSRYDRGTQLIRVLGRIEMSPSSHDYCHSCFVPTRPNSWPIAHCDPPCSPSAVISGANWHSTEK